MNGFELRRAGYVEIGADEAERWGRAFGCPVKSTDGWPLPNWYAPAWAVSMIKNLRGLVLAPRETLNEASFAANLLQRAIKVCAQDEDPAMTATALDTIARLGELSGVMSFLNARDP